MVESHFFGPSAGTMNTLTPCAACKLLRRKCAEECPFSPYFSPHEPHKFAAVHKVFGASNVSKMLMIYASVLRSNYFSKRSFYCCRWTYLYMFFFLLFIVNYVGSAKSWFGQQSGLWSKLEADRPDTWVHGCMGAVSALQQQIQSLLAELDAVRTVMMRHKFRESTTSNSISSCTSAPCFSFFLGACFDCCCITTTRDS